MIATGHNKQASEQIAKLLNEYNYLSKEYSGQDIIKSRAVYFPLTVGNLVLASVAIERLNFLITEVKHLTVLPNLRKLGLGKRLVSIAISHATTPFLIASVRSTNTASVKLFESLGFSIISEVHNNGSLLKVMGRPRDTTNLGGDERNH